MVVAVAVPVVVVVVCMDVCKDGWMDGWMDAWMDGCMGVCMYACMYRCRGGGGGGGGAGGNKNSSNKDITNYSKGDDKQVTVELSEWCGLLSSSYQAPSSASISNLSVNSSPKVSRKRSSRNDRVCL